MYAKEKNKAEMTRAATKEKNGTKIKLNKKCTAREKKVIIKERSFDGNYINEIN